LVDLQEKRFHDVSGQDTVLHAVLQKLTNQNALFVKPNLNSAICKLRRSYLLKYHFKL